MAFERGEPDRPIVVGRLYNEQNPPPYREANTTKTTVKSESVGDKGGPAEGFNEFRFDDQVEAEQIYLHAQRNLDEVVLANHTTSVGGNQANSVAGSQSNSVGGKRESQRRRHRDRERSGGSDHQVWFERDPRRGCQSYDRHRRQG